MSTSSILTNFIPLNSPHLVKKTFFYNYEAHIYGVPSVKEQINNKVLFTLPLESSGKNSFIFPPPKAVVKISTLFSLPPKR